ncbi:KAP family P-loop NTPase fold protein [Aureispira anguillae]|nr:KAP family NTPase [Aureispira anguillae]
MKTDFIDNKLFLFRTTILSIIITILIIPFIWQSINGYLQTLFLVFKSNKVGEYSILIYVLILLIWRFLIVDRDYKIGTKSLYLLTFTLLIYYFSKRLLNDVEYYAFKEIKLFCFEVDCLKSVDYLDFVFGFTYLFFLGSYFRQRIKDECSSLNEKEMSNLISEDFWNYYPMNDKFSQIKESLNKRKLLASNLCKELLNIKTDTSYAIAILGEWGTGKTQFLEKIENILEDKYNKKYVLIRHHPWKVSGETAIINDFFNLLREELQEYHGELNLTVNAYLEALFQKYKTWGAKTIQLLFSNRAHNKSVEEGYNALSKVIEEIPRKIIVMIDDLDRLDGDEIMGIMKLIRNVANFKNLIFIVAYDKSYVSRSIAEKLENVNGENYLEKIFQLEVTLPVFNPLTLQKLLLGLLSERLTDSWHKEKIGELVRMDSFTWEYLQTIRDIIRFVNLLTINYELLKQEVSFTDFYNVTLLKLKYTDCYEAIYIERKRWFLSGNTTSNKMVLKPLFEEEIKELSSIENNTKAQKLVIRTVKVLFDGFNLENDDFSAFVGTSNSDVKEIISINKKSSFYKYFSGHLRDNVLPRNQLIGIFAGAKEEIEMISKLNEWTVDGKGEFIRSYIEDFLSFPAIKEKENYEKGIRVLFKAKFLELDLKTLEGLLLHEHNINSIYEKEIEYKAFIVKCLKEELTIKDSLIMNLVQYATRPKRILSVEDAQSIYLFHLENYVKGITNEEVANEDFIANLLDLYRKAQSPNAREDDYQFEIYKNINEHLKNLIKQEPIKFIRRVIKRDEGKPNMLRLGLKNKEICFFFNNHMGFKTFCDKIINDNQDDEFYIGLKLFLDKWFESYNGDSNYAALFISNGRFFYSLKHPPVFINFLLPAETYNQDVFISKLSKKQDNIVWLEEEVEPFIIPIIELEKDLYIVVPESDAWKSIHVRSSYDGDIAKEEIDNVQLDLGTILENEMPIINYKVYLIKAKEKGMFGIYPQA